MARIPYINKQIICGNIGNEPVVRYMPNGDPVLSLRVATKESWKDSKDAWQSHTEWHTVVLYRKLAEQAAGYLKGDCVYVEGRKYTRKWVDEKQVQRTSVEMIGDDHHLVTVERADREESPADNSPDDTPPHTSMDGPESMKKLA